MKAPTASRVRLWLTFFLLQCMKTIFNIDIICHLYYYRNKIMKFQTVQHSTFHFFCPLPQWKTEVSINMDKTTKHQQNVREPYFYNLKKLHKWTRTSVYKSRARLKSWNYRLNLSNDEHVWQAKTTRWTKRTFSRDNTWNVTTLSFIIKVHFFSKAGHVGTIDKRKVMRLSIAICLVSGKKYVCYQSINQIFKIDPFSIT